MSGGPSKRLRQEIRALKQSPDNDILLVANDDNIRLWNGWIRGPSDTPFGNYVFQMKIDVGADYPMIPPAISFITKVFHPNVNYETGEICLDILKKEWSPAWSLQSACRAIIALLADPEADSPFNCDAGNMVRGGDLRAYHSLAHFYCEEYAEKQFPSL